MTLTRNDVLQIVRSRYTTKHYDPSKAVSEEDFNALLEVLRLSPSSVNSQPWEFFIARTPEARARLLPAIPDFNRQRVADASHVIVFVVHEKLDEQYLQELLAKETADGRFGNEEARAGQDAGRRHFVGLHSLSQQELLSWEMRQSYIAQGFLLFCKHFLSLRYRLLSLKAQVQILFHLLNTHAAFFQADEVLYPPHVVLVKDAAVVFITFDVGDKPLIAVKF